MILHECKQYSDSWWKVRRGVPTASEFSNIITAKTGKLSAGSDSYINRLIGDMYDENYGIVEDYTSAAMKNGKQGEPTARRWYAVVCDTTVDQVGFCTMDDGSFGCSPDALVGSDGGLELKCPQANTQVGYLLNVGPDGKPMLPDEYKQQVHGSLIVTGRKWWDFVSYYIGLPTVLIRIYPDEYTESLAKVMVEFAVKYNLAKSRIAAMQPAEVIEDEADEKILF